MDFRVLRPAVVVACALFWSLPARSTGNCANGQALYSAPVSGLSCASSSCHGPDPSRNINKIKNGAGNPSRIATAINGGVPEMAIFRGHLSASDLDDLATWIAAAPTCPAGGAPTITVSPATVAFPSQPVGSTSAPTTITVSNTGSAAATGLSVVNSNGTEFPAANSCPATLANGSSCTVSITFAPAAAGARSATLTLNSNAAAQTVALSGTGTAVPTPGVLSLPVPFTFSAQSVGSPSPAQPFTLTNTGGAAVTISSVTSSNPGEFPVSASTCSGSVAPNAGCTFSVTFTPSAAGARAASIVIVSTGVGSPQSLALAGTGNAVATPGALSVPSSYAFADQPVGVSSAPHAFTLANSGGMPVSIFAVTSSNAVEFALSSSSCTGTVAPGATCSFAVTFTPSAAGARAASITIAGSGSGSPQAIALTGNGTTAAGGGALTLPAAYVFADQIVGVPSAAHAFTLVNAGGTAVTVGSIASSSAEYVVAASTCAVIAPGASCSFAVTFTPAATGIRSASIVVTSSGAGSPQTLPVAGTGVAGSPPPSNGTEDLLEYYHPLFDHYFVTASPPEISLLTAGAFNGWVPTGLKFKSYVLGMPDTTSVCRFFSTAFAPKSSHFYTVSPAECDLVKTNPDWTFEGEVFNMAVPAGDGTCAAGLAPVYRLYNNGRGGAPNHRYTIVPDVRDAMIGQGWIQEGNGPGLAFMCAPQ